MLTITSVSTGITSLLFFIGGIHLYFSWKTTRSPLLKYFAIFLFSFGFQQLFFSLGTGILSLDMSVNGWLWGIAHVFMFVGISYFIRFPLNIRLVRFEKLFFRIAIAFSIIGIGVIFWNVPKLEGGLLANGVYIFLVPAMAGAVIGIFTTICLLLSFGIFVAETIKLSDKESKIKSLLIALGILVFLIGGPAHNFVKTPLLTFVVDLLIVAGATLMVAGVYVKQIATALKGSGPI